ncbi:TfpX/TfpZ family type IV pilin accessory protein [Pseudomonas nitroreducens]|uniref:TfpX/TfpZ family type IV pilin accessory protein n=1 Tax=Pseudomonas nitroreducens TaxID=46680 RepID=UPI002F350862
MSRYAAFACHFLISCIVGATLLALCWFVWYPAPMLMAIGGQEIFLLVLGVDVTLGPLLTLVVFNTQKKSLRFDLAVIALLQISALAYGVDALLEARPVYVAASGDSFEVIQAPAVSPINIDKAKVSLPWWGPEWVGTKAPEGRYDTDAVNDLRQIGAGPGHLPQLHIPYADMREQILANAKSISNLKTQHPDEVPAIEKWLSSHGQTDASVVYQPIKINATVYVVMLDAKSAEPLGIAPFMAQ